MKKILLIASLVLFLQIQCSAFASDVSGYFDKSLIYSGSSFPQSVAKSNTDTNNTPIPDLSKLKKGEATAQNILGIVEIGDASIATAANNGGITQIHYIDTRIGKVYVPLIFIPVYVKETKTIVYGI